MGEAVRTLLAMSGFGLVIGAVAAWSWPAAGIVAGLGILIFTVLWSRSVIRAKMKGGRHAGHLG